jgi:hypothetical protein
MMTYQFYMSHTIINQHLLIYYLKLSTIPIICHGYLHHDLPVSQKANLHENWAKLGLPSPAEGGVLLGCVLLVGSDHGENTEKWLANGSSPNMDKYGRIGYN